MNARTFLIHGLLAGLLAGVAAFVVAYTVGEPQVDAAIAVEEAGAAAEPAADEPADGHSHSHSDDEGTEVSRQNQSTFGLATGLLAVGTVLGGMVGLAAAFAAGRIGRLGIGASTALVATVGFVAYFLVPFLKYPATPPAVGNGDTIGDRTLYYFVYLAISLLAALAAVMVAQRLLPAWGTYRTVLATVVGFLAVVVIAGLAMPTVNEIGDFPGDTLWYFRRATLFTNGTLWAVIGVVLVGSLGARHRSEAEAHARRELADSL